MNVKNVYVNTQEIDVFKNIKIKLKTIFDKLRLQTLNLDQLIHIIDILNFLIIAYR